MAQGDITEPDIGEDQAAHSRRLCCLQKREAGWLWFAISGAGGGLIACNIGQAALAVSIYPHELRPTGIGFYAAMGRLGSIFGPATFGILFSIHWGADAITLVAVVPPLLALIALVAVRNSRAPRPIPINASPSAYPSLCEKSRTITAE